MQYIDITEKLEEFYRHLTEPDVDRTILSAKFGDGKTVFLQQFVEKYSEEFDFYTLYPVNYQIAPNEMVMEYIKRDILFQLILNGKITPDIEIPDSILLQWYISNKTGSILQDVMAFAPSVISSDTALGTVLSVTLEFAKTIKKQVEKFKGFKTKLEEADDFVQAANAIEILSTGKGNIYELDPITYLIAKSIAKSNKPSILIIEDLDRIDPAHLFRILNVFSAHIDRKYLASNYTIIKEGAEKELDQLPNKFGFSKVVFVMDADGTENIYKHFYGATSSYKGYMSKFLSKRVFRYSIIDYAHQLLMHHVNVTCSFDIGKLITILRDFGLDIEKLSVRDISRIIDDFEDSYRTVEIKINDHFRFMSDAPLVKLLATLLRMGVKEDQLIPFFNEIDNDEQLMSILGCFAVNRKSLALGNNVKYGGKFYFFSFDERNGYKVFENVMSSSPTGIDDSQYKILEIYLNSIITEALKYVN